MAARSPGSVPRRLAHGITGIFDVWDFPQVFKWQRDVDRGEVVGPKLRFSSPGIDEDDFAAADAIDAQIRSWAKRGYRWIKSHDLRTAPAFERVFSVATLGAPPLDLMDIRATARES